MSEIRTLLERKQTELHAPAGSFERLILRRDRKRRNQRIAAGVVGIAVFVAAVWVVTSGGSSDRTQKPANEPSRVNSAEDVARGFLAAFGAYDPEAAMTYVADDANLRGLIDPPTPANRRGLSLMLALAEVVDYQQTITWCHAVPLSSGTHVVCGYDFTTIDAVELGRGPFTGSTYTFIVRDGEIVLAMANPNLDQYASQVRAPFAEWLAATYPRDFEVMYGSIPPRPVGFRQVHYRLTEESIRLFRLRTIEYVESLQAIGPVDTGPAVTDPVETAPPPAPAPPAPDVVVIQRRCSDGAGSRLELTDRIKVRFEVYRSPPGHLWHIRMWRITSIAGDRVEMWRGARVASDSGDFAVVLLRRHIAGFAFKAKAIDSATGQVCDLGSTWAH